VQHVNRPTHNIRHYLGNLNDGTLKKDDDLIIYPSKIKTKIKNIFHNFKKVNILKFHKSYAALELNNHVDISRGDILVKNDKNFFVGDSFHAKLIVTSDENIFSGRQYLMRIHNKLVKATVTKIKKKNFLLNSISTKLLETNDSGEVEIFLNEKIVFSDFSKIKELSEFILIDLVSNKTVAAGKIEFALRKSGNIYEYKTELASSLRGDIKNQKPICIWLTGLSGSGKSTLARSLEQKLFGLGKHSYVLDGDHLRKGINKDLGFSENDRIENVRRVAEISKLMVDAGLITIVSIISPFSRERVYAKSLFKQNEFFEIYVSTPLNICKKRDVKGLYAKSKTVKDFNKIGMSNHYEKPNSPFLNIDTTHKSVESCVNEIFKKIFN
jgi:bifunctional enzyme CysN/CysC